MNTRFDEMVAENLRKAYYAGRQAAFRGLPMVTPFHAVQPGLAWNQGYRDAQAEMRLDR